MVEHESDDYISCYTARASCRSVDLLHDILDWSRNASTRVIDASREGRYGKLVWPSFEQLLHCYGCGSDL